MERMDEILDIHHITNCSSVFSYNVVGWRADAYMKVLPQHVPGVSGQASAKCQSTVLLQHSSADTDGSLALRMQHVAS